MRLVLVVSLCFWTLVGAWFAITKMSYNSESEFVSPLGAYTVLPTPKPSPSVTELILYKVPITKVTNTTITVKSKQGEFEFVKENLWVSKMHKNIVSNASPDLLEVGQRVDLQATKGKVTVLVLL